MNRRSLLHSTILFSSLFPIALSAALPLGCSAPAPGGGESTGSGDEALTSALLPAAVFDVAPTATDTLVSLRYERSVGSPLATATLSGPGGFTAAAREPLPTVLGPGGSGQHFLSFAGLQPCTAYGYQIALDGAVAIAESIHTGGPGGAACGAGEDLRPTHSESFHGVDHERFDHSWCAYDDWNDRWRGYPQGWDYASDEGGGADRARVGVWHSWDAGSDPFPCAERYVEVWRSRLTFTVQPWQAARATRARFMAGATSYDANGQRAPLCTSGLARLTRPWYTPNYDTTTKSDYGATWQSVMGPGAFARWGLEYRTPAQMLSMENGLAVAEVTNDVLPAATATAPTDFQVGFADPGDGFGQIDGTDPQFAQDNNVCFTDFTGPIVHLDYAPLPPNTPSNCAGTVSCTTGLTVTCDGVEGNALALHRVYSATDDTVIATGTGSVSYGDYLYAGAKSYYVCASNAAGTSCSEALPTPVTPSCGGGSSKGGSGSGGSGGGSTKCGGLKVCRQ